VWSLKFGARRAAALPLEEAIARVAIDAGLAPELDLVVAVPLHPRRLRERGFNQADLLAWGAARALRLPFRRVLRRVRDTPPQGAPTTLSRRGNVEGAFECRTSQSGRTVLLVDDVMTSGATFSECARALRRAGARRVYAVAAARGGLPGRAGAPVTESPGSPRACPW
jgi:ComF family protein